MHKGLLTSTTFLFFPSKINQTFNLVQFEPKCQSNVGCQINFNIPRHHVKIMKLLGGKQDGKPVTWMKVTKLRIWNVDDFGMLWDYQGSFQP